MKIAPEHAFRAVLAWSVIVAAGTILGGCFGGRTLHEKDYQRHWCDRHGGRLEYRLSDGVRVDCLTGDYAVEVEFAPKWAESVGQALYYASLTGKKPGVVLIMRDRGDERHLKRLRRLAAEQQVKVWTIRPKDVD